MSKPLPDDPDVPPEPPSYDDDVPPPPPEPSQRSASKPAQPLGGSLPVAAPPALAEQLLGSAEKSPPAPAAHAEGDSLTVGGARYRLMKRLGAGGMGEVYLARKLGAGGFERDVALKTVLPALAGHARAETFLKGFQDEARLAALLHHPNICQVYDLQPLDTRGLIQVLEYIPGHSLKDIINTARRKRVALSEAFVCYLAGELASALDYAHSAKDSAGRSLGIVHRDVTPHNIMVSTSGTVKLLDFGIAFSALDNREVTSSNMVKGKEQYYAPEQLVGGPLDGRTDQFALALCLYETLALKRFFSKGPTEQDTALFLRIAQLTPESVEGTLAASAIDATLKSALHHALAPSRDERFATCGEFGDALRIFSQRRGWLYTAADAKKELDALFLLPDAADADKTTPSGKKAYSHVPRSVPPKSMVLPPLTPGRTAMTPPVPPVDASVLKKALPAAAPARSPAAASGPATERALPPIESLPPLPESPAEDRSKQSAVVPSETAQRRRLQLQEDLHNPKSSAKKLLAVPAAILAGTLIVGVVVVKLFLLGTAPSVDPHAVAEVVKTPEQLRAEREVETRAAEPSSAPPELAPVQLPERPPAQPGAAGKPAAGTLPAGRPAASPGQPGSLPRPAGSHDAKAVDAILAQQYGGRPVVTPDAPAGAVAGAAPAAPVQTGPRRRSLDTVMVADAPPADAAGAGPHLPKGTMMAARLTTPADASQPAPVNAVLTADVVVGGAVVVPRGSAVVCMTSPNGGRLGLSCDTLRVAGKTYGLDAIAMGADRRVGLPLPRVAVADTSLADIAKDRAVTTARNALGRVTPDGVAGDVVNGAADTAGAVANRQGTAGDAIAPLLPAGTAFTLFVQSPLN